MQTKGKSKSAGKLAISRKAPEGSRGGFPAGIPDPPKTAKAAGCCGGSAADPGCCGGTAGTAAAISGCCGGGSNSGGCGCGGSGGEGCCGN
jgi:hypothetical protein